MQMNAYDFDNTIYRGESILDLFFFYMKKNPSMARYLPMMLAGLVKYKLRMITIEQLLEAYSLFAEKFFYGLESFQDDMVEFWDKHMHKIKPFYYAQREDDDLIITASAEIFLRELFQRLDIKNYIGTEIDEQTAKIVFLCFRANKIEAFRKRYPDAVIDNFYTDSLNDKPLMDLSTKVFLVKGNRLKQIKPKTKNRVGGGD